MEDSELIEHTVSSEPVYDGKLLHVRRDMVRLPDGHEMVREWIAHPGAVVIIAGLDNGKLLFERQFRYPCGASSPSFPPARSTPANTRWIPPSASCAKKPATRPNSGVTSAPCTPASAIPTSASKSSGLRA
jgi:hypothetical protein